MANVKVLEVISLGYIGGQDEELGGYCEPLVVKLEGREEYLLHRMGQHYEEKDGKDEVINDHQRLIILNRPELVQKWGIVRAHLRSDFWIWEDTTSTCGYQMTDEEFYGTKRTKQQT